MKAFTIAAAASAVPLVAGLKMASAGGAKVINKCSWDIPLKSVPAIANGIENGVQTEKTLAAYGTGDSEWFSSWTQLLTPGGWSIKLNTINSWTNILQYEYTWANDGQLWYDNSFVDGLEKEHPPWQFVCPDCPSVPHCGAYQHSTDDMNGMQRPTSDDTVVTLILCPGTADQCGGPGPSPAASAAPATSVAAAPTTTEAPPAPSTTLETSVAPTTTAADLQLKQANVVPAAEPAPAVAEVVDAADPYVVTAYETKVITAVVYETAVAQAPKHKRHAHGHPHGHHA